MRDGTGATPESDTKVDQAGKAAATESNGAVREHKRTHHIRDHIFLRRDAVRRLSHVGEALKLGYADPPYIGCAHLYRDHADYGGEVDHAELIDRLQSEYGGWVLHASATPASMAILAPLVEKTGARWCSWVKGFAAGKKNVPTMYAWEPVIIKPARKPVVSKRLVNRDWIMCSITLRKGLTGVKPEAVCHWAFELVAACPGDELHDMFPGTGAVAAAWKTWEGKFTLPVRLAAE